MKDCDIKIFLLLIFIKIIILRLSFNVMISFFNNKKRDRRLIDNVFNVIMINIKFFLFFIRDSIACLIVYNII